MTIEDGELTAMSAEDYRDKYLRFVKIRNPDAKIGPGEYDYIKAQNLANLMITVSNDAKVIAGKISLQDRTGDLLDEIGKPISEGGIGCPHPQAIGSSGSVTIQAISSGTQIQAEDELKPASGVAFYCTKTGVYFDGDSVPVMCRETGPNTNVDAGTVMTWSNPRPGCFATATVTEQTDGTGLTGGADKMGDDDYRELLAEKKANPAASVNQAALRAAIGNSRNHGVNVAQAFTYGAFPGPGMTAFTFTLPGSQTNSSRLPNEAQINAVGAYLDQIKLSTDGIVKVPLVDDNLAVSFRIKWSNGGWSNSVPWPAYASDPNDVFYVSRIESATEFTVTADNSNDYNPPQVGNVIAFFDKKNGKVIKKTIATVSGNNPYTITCETLAGASDLVFSPDYESLVFPWADSLQLVLDKTIEYVNNMGPGEIVATLPEDGFRVAREPANAPGEWPSQIDSRLESSIANIPNVKRVSHIDGFEFTTRVGGITAIYLAKLDSFAVYAL